ncbi:MAG TPA: hypothetical protein VK178_07070 [Opitutaceae bacterium]|nr:hypothetical protein [Opitutaceae bacterium]
MATHQNTPAAAGAGNNFVAVLTQLHRGSAVVDASEGLAEVVKAVRENGKKGKLTLTIAVVPLSKGDAVDLVCEVTTKTPKPNKGSSLFFVSEDGTLVRNDPRQGELKLTVVGEPTKAAPPARTGS